MSIVSVAQLNHSYGERRALNDVTFDVAPGEVFGLLGPNGGGKSTLFRVLSTLLPKQSGSATVAGFDVLTQSDQVRRSIGVTFQSPSLDLKLTVMENLRFQAQLYGMSGRQLQSRCDEVLAQFGIADRAKDYAEKLSGGLKRRVEIAKCLLHAPSILLLDEPSTGLDPGARHDLWESLFELRKSAGVTILVTTHLMEEADRCTRLGILDQGKLIALGTPDELRHRVGGDSVTIRADDLTSLKADLERELNCEVQQLTDAIRVEQEDGHNLLARIATDFSGRFRTLTLGKPTLEDVFIKLTGRGLHEEVSKDE